MTVATRARPDNDALDAENLPVPIEVVAAAKRAYPEHRRRRQCSYQDFESGYIAHWIENRSNGHATNGHVPLTG